MNNNNTKSLILLMLLTTNAASAQTTIDYSSLSKKDFLLCINSMQLATAIMTVRQEGAPKKSLSTAIKKTNVSINLKDQYSRIVNAAFATGILDNKSDKESIVLAFSGAIHAICLNRRLEKK